MGDNEEVCAVSSCSEDDLNTHADGAALAVYQRSNKGSDSIEPQHE